MSGRARLPNRRDADVLDFEFNGLRFTMSIGRYSGGRAGEVFLRSAKPGSMLDDLLADAAVVVSLALQNGITPAELAKSLGRSGGGRASILGQALDMLAEIDR